MKILIVGTGVIGTLYGHALSKFHEIIHFVRKNKLDTMNNKTIYYDIIDEREDEKNIYTKGQYTYNCVSTACRNYDLIIVPVNTFQLDDVLKTLEKDSPDSNYLLFTLNWIGTKNIDNILNKNQYVMGYPGSGGTFKEDLLWGNIGNDIMLGTVYKEQIPLFNSVVDIFKKCGIIPDTSKNILHSLWMHNIGASPMGVALSKYNDINKFLDDKKLVEVSINAMSECYNICEKRGVDLSLYPEVEMYKMPFDTIYPMIKNNILDNPVAQRYTAHAVLAIDEMKENFKQMFKSGIELGVDMPNMKKLSTLL